MPPHGGRVRPGTENRGGPGDPLGPLAVLLEDPPRSAVLSDFDGTLAPIVADPATAAPLPEAPGVLAALTRHFGLVAVISGRPVSFLAQRLAAAGPGLHLFGAYGLEWLEGGEVRRAPEAQPWQGEVARVVEAAREAFAGEDVGIEDKGVSVTVHWRQAPDAGERALDFARTWSQRTGLIRQPGRMAVEFRPPISIDKGCGGRARGPGHGGGVLRRRRRRRPVRLRRTGQAGGGGTRTVRVAVVDEETPPDLVAAADIVVPGPADALDLFSLLARRARP